MKNIVLLLMIALSVISCQKNDLLQTDPVLNLLQENLTAKDFARIDRATAKEYISPSTGQRIIRADFAGVASSHEFVILRLNGMGQVSTGRIILIQGKIEPAATNSKKLVFNGSITARSLQHSDIRSSAIIEGFIMALHTSSVTLNNVRTNTKCYDCTIPEVVVSSSRKYEDPFAWLNIFWADDTSPKMEYLPIGGGGGGPSDLNMEDAGNKDKIDTKKYMDCFDNIPDGPTTIYSLTISADLPADARPDVFFDWSDRFPGHAFIELNKSTAAGTVSQSIGFYPKTSFKVLTGDYIDSKMVDDGGHEYQARYTITVTAAQFRAAINKANSASSNQYQVSHYNCTDFALDVFNAAGGNLTIPRHGIPGFEIDGGSNTPQGLYEKIEQLKNNGTAGASSTRGKEYANGSKGPCN